MEGKISKYRTGVEPQGHFLVVRVRVKRQGVNVVDDVIRVSDLDRFLFVDNVPLPCLFVPGETVETSAHVNKFNSCTVAVQVNQTPQGLSCIYTTEKHAFVSPVDPKVDLTVDGEVVVDQRVRLRVPFRECLGPVAWLAGQVGTSILGQALESVRVVRSEAKTQDSTPSY